MKTLKLHVLQKDHRPLQASPFKALQLQYIELLLVILVQVDLEYALVAVIDPGTST